MGTPLDSAKYANLETFRKDGSGVKTPIWLAPLDGKLVMSTTTKTYKIKRIRNNPRVRLAACNASGSQNLGPWYEGKARLVEAPESARGEAAITAKYGLMRHLLTFFAKVSGRLKDRILIEVELTGESDQKV